MGKGSNTTTTNSSSSSSSRPDENAYQSYLALMNRAGGVASTPYQGYGGEETAPINDQQRAGFGAINSAQGAITATGAPISAADIQRYQDPYTNSVIDATQRDFDVQNGRQQSQTTGNAAAQGALGGDRSAVAAALTAEGQSRSQAPVIAGLRSQGYQNAVKTAEDQQQQALRAGVAGLQGGQAMVGAGTLEQQTQQAKDTQGRLDYYQQQGYPFQVAQWLAQMTTGVGSQMGGTSNSTGTSTKEGPAPNPWAQLAGGAMTAAAFAHRGGRISGVHRFADGGAIRLSDDEIHAFREWKAQHYPEAGVHKYAGGGSPWGGDQTWIPQVGGITAGRGAPQAPALPSDSGSPEQQKGASPDMMKGVGAVGKKIGGLDFGGMSGAMEAGDPMSGDAWGGGSFSSGSAWGGSGVSPLPGLDASDYGLDYRRGGRIAGFAEGGIVPLLRGEASDAKYDLDRDMYDYATRNDTAEKVSGERFHDSGLRIPGRQKAANDQYSEKLRSRRRYATGGSPLLEDDDGVYRPMAAGVGASRPAFDVVNPDQPFRMLDRPSEDSEPPALDGWRKGVDKDVGLGQSSQNEAPLPPEVISGRSKPPVMARGTPEEGDEGPSQALGYSGAPRTISGVGAPPPQPEGGQDEGFLSRLGVRMTPELKQGLLQAGLSMMATRRGGAGSFLQAAGEAGMTGVGAYSQTQQLAREAEDKARKEGFEREKFDRPYNEMTAAQRATQAKEYKPTWGVIRTENDPDTGLKREVYGWIDPNTKQVTEGPSGASTPAGKPKSVYVDDKGQPVTGDDFLTRLKETSPERALRAKSVGDYKVNPAGLSVRGGRREQAIADATAYNPNYDQREYSTSQAAMKNFSAGVESRAVRSLNVAIDHLSTLDEAAKAMQNGDYQVLNRVVNTWREQTGNPLPTNFDSIKQVVSAEIAKAVVGGQTALHDRDDMAQRAKNAQSTDVLLGISQQFRKLMAGQMKGLRQTYESTTKSKNFDEFLLPETKKALKGLEHVEDSWNKDGSKKSEGTKERTVVRSGTVNSGDNKGKKVIEYSDGTREYQ